MFCWYFVTCVYLPAVRFKQFSAHNKHNQTTHVESWLKDCTPSWWQCTTIDSMSKNQRVKTVWWLTKDSCTFVLLHQPTGLLCFENTADGVTQRGKRKCVKVRLKSGAIARITCWYIVLFFLFHPPLYPICPHCLSRLLMIMSVMTMMMVMKSKRA